MSEHSVFCCSSTGGVIVLIIYVVDIIWETLFVL